MGDVFAIDLAEFKPNDDKVNQFADYITDNYIDENSTFPPNMWATMSSSIQRSTNACESFHSKYNSYFISTHPHIYKFLNVLNIIQSDTYILIRSSTTEIKKMRQATKCKINFIDNVIEQLNTNQISRLQYVQTLANKFKPRQQ